MYKIEVTQEMGRGLFANQFIMPDQIIFEAELLVLNEVDTKKVNETELKYYTFKYNDLQDCLVLGDGELFNHNGHPNVDYKLVEVDGRFKMRFTATQVILSGSQLFIDYNADIRVEIEHYIKSESLTA